MTRRLHKKMLTINLDELVIEKDDRRVLRALVQYGLNVSSCMFYIKRRQIARFAGVENDYVVPSLEKLEIKGYISSRYNHLYDAQHICLKADKIGEDYPKYGRLISASTWSYKIL